MTACSHAKPVTGRPHTIRCALGLFGGRPHVGVCRHCSIRTAGNAQRAVSPVKRKPCSEELAELGRRAQECVDALRTSGDPAAAHNAMRLRAARTLAFTPYARPPACEPSWKQPGVLHWELHPCDSPTQRRCRPRSE